MTWKCAPKTAIFLSLASVLMPLLNLIPATCIAGSVLVASILGCHGGKPCLFGTGPPGTQADVISLRLRQLLAQLRELKKDAAGQARLLRQASALLTSSGRAWGQGDGRAGGGWGRAGGGEEEGRGREKHRQ